MKPDYLMQLANGFAASTVLAVAVKNGLFTVLNERDGVPSGELIQLLGFQDRPGQQFLAACTALGLIETSDDNTHRNSKLSSAFLVPGQPGHLGGYIEFLHDREYPAWHRLDQAMHNDQPLTWDIDGPATSVFDPANPILPGFLASLHPMAIDAGIALAPLVQDRKAVLDVGGGTGGYAIGLCQRLPHLTATVYDLPFVTEITRTYTQTTPRVSVMAGNFLTDQALPDGHDTVLLASVLHDWDPATNAMLLTKAFTALPPGGLVIIGELMLEDTKTGPIHAALMGLNMVVETKGGRSYTPAEHTAALTAAGFTQVRSVPLELPVANYALAATRP